MAKPRKKKCGAKLRQSRKGRKFCPNPPVKGGTRCRMHGGTQQKKPPGDEARGGRPAESGVYAKFLPKGLEDKYADVAEALGSLDNEIRVARAFMARALENDDGEAVGELTERIRRLESSRGKLIRNYRPANRKFDSYAQFLKKRSQTEAKK